VRTLRIAAAVGLAAAVLPLAPARVGAQAVLLKTDYPAVVVEAGKSVKFDVDVVTSSPRRVDLRVTEAPPGWQTTLRGGGFVIDGVFGDPEEPPAAELEVRIPPEAPPGEHQVVLTGSSGAGSGALRLTLRVSEQAAGAVSLEAEFPSFRGEASETFTFRLTLENNTPEETTFNLSAEGPPGWTVNARPTAETRAATVTVDGGETADIEVSVDPPDIAEAREHPILVAVNGGGDKQASVELTVEITGSINLTLTTSDERLSRDGGAGRTTDVVLVVRNEGSSPLRDISFSPTPPSGWEVTFEPEAIEDVPPGEEGRVTAHITPSGEAVAGDYTVNLSANAAQGSDAIELRMTIRPSRFWGFFALLLIVGAFFGLRWVFQRYGRR
jgi:uncharacterized membrane protein